MSGAAKKGIEALSELDVSRLDLSHRKIRQLLSDKRMEKNHAVDRQIHEVVGGVAPGWAARGVTVMYHTMYTGLCKPKGAQAMRLLKIAVAPPTNLELGNMQGYGASEQVMAVTLPQNCIPGHVMQVQAPNGTVVSVAVPAGGTPGMVLQVKY